MAINISFFVNRLLSKSATRREHTYSDSLWKVGFEPSLPCNGTVGLVDRSLKPLGYFSRSPTLNVNRLYCPVGYGLFNYLV